MVREGCVDFIRKKAAAEKKKTDEASEHKATPPRETPLAHVDGRVCQPHRGERSGVALVWQDLALCENLDIAGALLLGEERRRLLSPLRFHATAAALLRQPDIPIRDTMAPVASLSGGQRQLVAVARAMGRKPRGCWLSTSRPPRSGSRRPPRSRS